MTNAQMIEAAKKAFDGLYELIYRVEGGNITTFRPEKTDALNALASFANALDKLEAAIQPWTDEQRQALGRVADELHRANNTTSESGRKNQ